MGVDLNPNLNLVLGQSDYKITPAISGMHSQKFVL